MTRGQEKKALGLGIADLEDFTLVPQILRADGSKVATSDELKAYLEGHAYADDLTVPADEGVLFYDELLIGSRGNIVAINGRAKSRKSVIASAMMSSAFCESFLGFSTRFFKDPKVLHFDTEQGYGDWLEGCHRVIRDAGLEKKPAGFVSHHSRDCMVEMRLELLRYALDLYRPDVLVIDGVTDLVYDLNSQDEATKVGGELMAWSVKYNCLIVVIIHLTKGNGYMTGALGTYLEKKCQTAIKCEKDENDDTISNISCQYARRKPFRPFGIRFNDTKGVEQYERLDETKQITKSTPPGKASDELKARLLNAVFNIHTVYNHGQDLRQGVYKAGTLVGIPSMSKPDITAWIKYWNENQLIGPDPEGKICKLERLEIIEKIMPRIDFDTHQNGSDQAPEHDPDDLPF